MKRARIQANGAGRGSAAALSLAIATATAMLSAGCSGESTQQETPSKDAGADSASQGGASGEGGATGSGSGGAGGSQVGSGGAGGVADPGPNVDTSDPQLYKASFKPDAADPEAKAILGTQLAHLDTTVEPRGLLVVYLHGAGAPSTCGSDAHSKVLAKLGFHVLCPCYVSDYGVGGCGSDIEGCRLEAFDGADHHKFIDIKPPDSIEVRVAKGLAYVQTQIPKGDWTYFLDGDKPRWSKIVISGISHGASSAGVIGLHRLVSRVVSLSGPLDSGQAWLKKAPLTPIEQFYAFSHTGDSQHAGHLKSFADMGLPGDPTPVDGASPPYGGSHRLITSAPTQDGHGSTQAGGSSPKTGTEYAFQPVWTYLYTSAP